MLQINEATKNDDLKLIRSEIMANANNGIDILMYHNPKTGEEIILSCCMLTGNLNGKLFNCSCYSPMSELFFKESRDLQDTNPRHYQSMSTSRVHEFLDEIDARLATVDNSYHMRLQMHTVRERYDLECRQNPHKRKAQQQLSEAEAAKQRRLENEERNRKRKAEREAERLKRKKIAQTTKRVNADAAKAAAERKAEEERKAQMQKEAQLKAQEEAIREENKRTTENMLAAFDKHKNLPPVYDQDNDGNDCFYLKINNKVMHVVMSDTAPLCHQLSLEPRASTPLDVHDIQDIMTNINDHLNAKGDFDELLCNFALFYKRCQDIISNKSAIANKRAAKVSKNPKGVIVHKHTVRPLYGKVCHRLMRPSTFNVGNQR